ncbi:MAG: hypothetical protein IH602_21040 [Bryobacteraceae bacterium]|nr:hypothetical protein [Bryobacteraceae bacterium]
MKLHIILIPALLGLGLAGCGSKSGVAGMEPSRAAKSGCEWVAAGDDALGVKFLVENCGGKRPSITRKANVIQIGDGGARIEVYGKLFAQPAIGAIKEQFLSRLSPEEFKGCIVTPQPENLKAPKGMNVFAIVPSPDYLMAAKAKRDADPAAMICGDHGQGPVQSFFLAEQANAGGRLLHVFAGGEDAGFDALSARLETDKAMSAKLEQLPVENLETAELAAFALESDLKRFQEAGGQWIEGERESSYSVFSKDSQPVVVVEQAKVSDKVDAGIRSYYRGGKLFLIRANELATRSGISKSQDVIWKRIAFGADGKVMGSRAVVNGVAMELSQQQIDEAVKAASAVVEKAAKQ